MPDVIRRPQLGQHRAVDQTERVKAGLVLLRIVNKPPDDLILIHQGNGGLRLSPVKDGLRNHPVSPDQLE